MKSSLYLVFLSILFCAHLLYGARQEDSQALSRKAVEAERRGEFAEAVSAFEELIRRGADSPELRSNLGIAYFQLRDFNRALRELRVALAADPRSVPANLFSGLSLINLRRPRQALPYLRKAHASQPQDLTVLLAIAQAEVACNDTAAARGFYEQATRLDAGNAEAWYGLGITSRVLAEQQLKQSKLRNSNREAASQAARSLIEASGQAMTKAMQLDPSSVRAHMVLGESLRIAERYDDSVREYKAATEAAPKMAPAWAGLAAAYSASGANEDALKAAQQALELDSADAETAALIAGIYLRQGDYSSAESYANRALQVRPDLPSARVVLAKLYLAEQQPQKALRELQSAAKDDTDGSVYYLLATTFRQLGKAADAAAAMQKYKQLHHLQVAPVSN